MKNKIKNYKKYVAFTLAEVLITLAIIGVVAALTIPTVLKNYKKTQLETALKKNYATLTQATIKAQVDHGSMSGWGLTWGSLNSDDADVKFIKTYIAPYLNVAETAYGDKTLGDFGYKEDIKTKTNEVFSSLKTDSKYNMLRLADGTVYFISKTSSSYCPYEDKNICIASNDAIIVYADTNGAKGPNVLGKDIFSYQYQIGGDRVYVGNERIVNVKQNVDNYAKKAGISSEEAFEELKSKNDYKWSWQEYDIRTLKTSCYNKETYNTEGSCGALIKKNGWKVPDDYPWL